MATNIFWNFVINGIAVLLCHVEISQDLLLHTILPISTKTYWYMTGYFIVELLAPIVDLLIQKMDKNFEVIYIVGTLILSVFITTSGNNAVWLLCCYCGGALIKKYDNRIRVGRRYAFIGYCICVGITWLSQFCIDYFAIELPKYIQSIWRGRNDGLWPSSMTMFCAGLFLLICFKEMNNLTEKQRNIIHKIAPLQLSVYLITVSPLVWKNILQGAFEGLSYNIVTILVGVPICTIIINVCCMCFENVRIQASKMLFVDKKK